MDTTQPVGAIPSGIPPTNLTTSPQPGLLAQDTGSQQPSESTSPLFGEDVFAAMGAADIPESDKAVLMLKMAAIVQTRVLDRVYQLLNPTQQQQLVSLMDSEDFEGTDTFLQSAVPGYQNLFLEEAKVLRRELIARAVA